MTNPNQPPLQPPAEEVIRFVGMAAVPKVTEADPGWNGGVGSPDFSPHDGYTARAPHNLSGAGMPTEAPVAPGKSVGSSPEELDRLPAISEADHKRLFPDLSPGSAFPVRRTSGRDEVWSVDKIVLDPLDGAYKIVVSDSEGHYKTYPIGQAALAKSRYNQSFAPKITSQND